MIAGDADVVVAGLHVYPVKSCAGIALDEALLVETGIAFDRAWMVVDADRGFVSQRTMPRIALVQTALRLDDMVLRAPGMLALHVALDRVESPCRVRLRDADLAAYDMGDIAAQWFTDFLGAPLRMVRFDPEQKRLSDAAWTGAVAAENAFSDGFPLLVAAGASLADLNARLAARGCAPVEMRRFRPNLVIDGVEAYDEDHIDEIAFETGDGPIRLKLVKPCTRCSVPNVDPATAETGIEPGATLAGYRADARFDGAITFAMNAVVVEGVDRVLKRGMRGRAAYRF